MGVIKRILKGAAERLACRASQAELFEKPGERAATPPLPSPPKKKRGKS